MKKQITSLIRELDIDLSMSATEKVAKIRSYGQDLGYSLSEVIDEIHHSLDETHHSRVKPIYAEDLSSPSSVQSSAERRRRCSFKLISRVDAGQEDSTRRQSAMEWNNMRQYIQKSDPNSLLKPKFRPWKKNIKQEIFVKNLDSSIMSTWGISFCGGSGGVISDLRGISFDYGIDLHIDSFAW